jgi:hypothetical protein
LTDNDEVTALRADLNTALNEATVVGATVDPVERKARIALAILALPAMGPPNEDPRAMIVLAPVGRVCASLRDGQWDDAAAPVRPFILSQLMDVVRSFGEQAIYGWDFIDRADDDHARWSRQLSLDEHLGERDGLRHTLDIFQESGAGPARHLDLRFWFDMLYVFKPVGDDLVRTPLDLFAAEGKRWWQGLNSGDPRTSGHGIIPGTPTPEDIRRIQRSLDDSHQGRAH